MSALIWPDAGLDEVPLPLSTVIATAAPIAFVGMAGVGKSAVARRVATALGVECIDIDAEVSAVRGGQSVSSIFDEIGEDEFRALETAALLDALDGACNGVRGRARRAVIATGGGVVERQRIGGAFEQRQRRGETHVGGSPFTRAVRRLRCPVAWTR